MVSHSMVGCLASAVKLQQNITALEGHYDRGERGGHKKDGIEQSPVLALGLKEYSDTEGVNVGGCWATASHGTEA